MTGTHVIIIGGISVNDSAGHDRYPYNFINPAVARAKLYGSNVLVVVFSPSYEVRVDKQEKEHNIVTYTYADTCAWGLFSADSCPSLLKSKERNPRHFVDVISRKAIELKFAVSEIRDRHGLTTKLNSISQIASIDYFGHSDAKSMFLEYSVSAPGASTIYWGVSDAGAVPASKFAPGASFISFGCNQGDPGGLAEQLRALWRIRTAGSQGKTNFEPIGRGQTLPSTADAYYEYPADGGPRRRLSAPP